VCGQEEADDVSMSYLQSTNPSQEQHILSKPITAPLTVYIQKHATHSASHHPKKQHVKRSTKSAPIDLPREFPMAPPLPPPPPPPPLVVPAITSIQPPVVAVCNGGGDRHQFMNVLCDYEIMCSLKSLCIKWEKKMLTSMIVFLEDHLHYRAFSSFVVSLKPPSVQEVFLLFISYEKKKKRTTVINFFCVCFSAWLCYMVQNLHGNQRTCYRMCIVVLGRIRTDFEYYHLLNCNRIGH